MIPEIQAAILASTEFSPVAGLLLVDEPVGNCVELVPDGPENGMQCDMPTVPGTEHCRYHLLPGEAVETLIEPAAEVPPPATPPFYPLPTDDHELSLAVDNPYRVLALVDSDAERAHRWLRDVLGDVVNGPGWLEHPARPVLDELVACLEVTS